MINSGIEDKIIKGKTNVNGVIQGGQYLPPKHPMHWVIKVRNNVIKTSKIKVIPIAKSNFPFIVLSIHILNSNFYKTLCKLWGKARVICRLFIQLRNLLFEFFELAF